MFQERIQRIKNIINDAGADAFVVVNHEESGQPGTQYLSGFSGSESIILVAKEGKFIFTDGRYYSQVKEECPSFELVPIGASSNLDHLVDACRKLRLEKIGFDSTTTYHSFVSSFNERLEQVSLVGMENALQKIRISKDEEEIVSLQKAAVIAAGAFKKLLPHIKEGVTEKSLARKLEVLMREEGANKISFDTIVASGVNGAKPHARPSDKKIINGELITFDFGCFFGDYASDTTRTVAIGAVPEKLKEIYEVVRVAQELGCQAARAGISGADLDAVCRDYVSSRGYGDYFLHGTGHGLGMEVHELPLVSRKNTDTLPENSVVTIEPGIYIEGLGGVRIEDAIVLKSNGNINLNSGLTKELLVL